VKRVQGGTFNDHLLCSRHEDLTSVFDKYAIEFVRAANQAWGDRSTTNSLEISNLHPNRLRSFALLTIWRETESLANRGKSLGPYNHAIQQHLFFGDEALDWPVFAHRTNFRISEHPPLDFNVHPYRIRFAERSGWAFIACGIGFFVVSDKRGAPTAFEDLRADISDPVILPVSDPLPVTQVGSLQPIFSRMRPRFKSQNL
jgi:hypothetical protein